MTALKAAILALAAFGSAWQCLTAAEAQNACMGRAEARRAVPGAYLYWRGGLKGQRCWYTVASRTQNKRTVNLTVHHPVSLTGQEPTNRPGSINSRPDSVTGQDAITQVEVKNARNLRDYHPGNTPGITPPVNILDHPVWAWVEAARLSTEKFREVPSEIQTFPPEGGKGFAFSELREHDLPGAVVYSSFAKGAEPEVWPDIKSYPGKQSTALWGAVGALLVLAGAMLWLVAGVDPSWRRKSPREPGDRHRHHACA